MAMELSNKNWKLAFSNGEKIRHINVTAGDQEGLRTAIKRSKEKLGLAAGCPVHSCYEAGRDGFWIDRCLGDMGVKNFVVDPASIEVNRRRRRVKTDRLDAESLVRMLMRYVLHNEKTVWRVVVVPAENQEDERRPHRELERLTTERTGHLCRIRSLLVQHGIRARQISGKDSATLKDWRGVSLPEALSDEIRREQERLAMVEAQIKVIETVQKEHLKTPVTFTEQKAVKLKKLKGIGQTISWRLSKEMFWRHFDNRRQVGAFSGLTATMYASGNSLVEQGISKAGNRRVRATLIELAWMWTWHQPNSELTKWFMKRFWGGGKRMRRIGIVALARKLLVALWKYVEFDEVPAGAIVRA